MKKLDAMVWGLILIIVGSVLILGEFGIFRFNNLMEVLWPMIFIIPGIMFHYSCFSKGYKRPGLLVPGGILLTYGIIFQLGMLFGNWDVLSPGFILGPAIGLFELYYFGKRQRGLLIPIFILTGVAALVFFSVSYHELKWLTRMMIPAAMIIMGIGFVVKRDVIRHDPQNKDFRHDSWNHFTNDHNGYYDNQAHQNSSQYQNSNYHSNQYQNNNNQNNYPYNNNDNTPFKDNQ